MGDGRGLGMVKTLHIQEKVQKSKGVIFIAKGNFWIIRAKKRGIICTISKHYTKEDAEKAYSEYLINCV